MGATRTPNPATAAPLAASALVGTLWLLALLTAVPSVLAEAASGDAASAGPTLPAATLPTPAASQALWYFDQDHGRIGFEIAAVGVLTFKGHFQRFSGGVFLNPDNGLARVQLDIDATSLAMNRNRYQYLARSADFFAIDEHPRIGFVSEPFPIWQPPWRLRGRLQLRGQLGEVAFLRESAPCIDPARVCTMHAQGELDRRAFGMRAWRTTLANHVRLQIQLQAQPVHPSNEPAAPSATADDAGAGER
ncbi:MAG: YceI family protein [Xanthomonadales bacterium]|nr:YceI family protein [Xanthomonadales bacterium]